MFGMGRKKRILVIDDDEDLRATVELRFATRGYDVLHASCGRDGLALADSERPDAIVLDINMPGMDGFETCRRLRDGRKTRNIPIIMLTACKRIGELEEGLNAGADTYLTKPFDGPALVDEVEKVVENRRRMAQRTSAAPTRDSELSHAVETLRHLPRTLGAIARVRPGILLARRDDRLISRQPDTPQHRPIIFEDELEFMLPGRPQLYMRFTESVARSLCPDASIFDVPNKVLIRRTFPPLTVAPDCARLLVDKAILCAVPTLRTVRADLLLGLLASRAASFALTHVVDRAKGGVLPWVTPQEVERIPLPGDGSMADRDRQHEIASMASELTKRAAAGIVERGNSPMRDALDAAVCAWMGIDLEVVRIHVS